MKTIATHNRRLQPWTTFVLVVALILVALVARGAWIATGPHSVSEAIETLLRDDLPFARQNPSRSYLASIFHEATEIHA